LGTSLAQSLWRDHRRTHAHLAPLLADLLLAADAAEAAASNGGSSDKVGGGRSGQAMGDGALWRGVLAALQQQNQWRDLLELLPRLGLALQARRPAWAEQHELELAGVWQQALHRPLLELQHRKSNAPHHRPPQDASGLAYRPSAAHPTLPTLASSLVFGALAPPPTLAATIAATTAAVAAAGARGEQAFGGLEASAVVPVLLLVEAGLAHCPFPDHVDACALAQAMALALDGSPKGAAAHQVAARIASIAGTRCF
jgi:hypothetical protein